MGLRSFSVFLLSLFFLSSPLVALCLQPPDSCDGITGPKTSHFTHSRNFTLRCFAPVACASRVVSSYKRKCRQAFVFPTSTRRASPLSFSFIPPVRGRAREDASAPSRACRSAVLPPVLSLGRRLPEGQPPFQRCGFSAAALWFPLIGTTPIGARADGRIPYLAPLSQVAWSGVPLEPRGISVVESVFLPSGAQVLGRHGTHAGRGGEHLPQLFASGDRHLPDSGDDGAAMERVEKEEVHEETTTTQENKEEEQEVEDDQKKQAERRARLKAWQVVLHNDEIHAIPHVTDLLVDAVPSLTKAKAHSITVQAHKTGLALVLRTWREKATEIYRKLKANGLTISLVPSKRKDKQEDRDEGEGIGGTEDGDDDRGENEDIPDGKDNGDSGDHV
ncbi:ATP-dependent Clp protease adaptor protein ClpS protein [Toxoplasma gondii ME49]|uniref:ATP-dependent Clp protease adaptor domain-containing protein n=10 Tax=Toxoplasma gondii TaxID=5811 RepID=B9Q249_TOXGV|nr:ATP-dependent Clp protease adaptor protein ClpS protein [Toxoplasma gondii ME49]EPR57750.1 ATP-dependent Clp protease adaptor protein ClpS protein [Toxoplasma gondii GT1]ESS29154.1 ATP-dependent Clp protease adaptor protein ClpS protein [Toxoplasma gondii VEG]KAF4646247.1 ATP-dependent Clp protease adaptor protein ClpS protein [Toxoplasma gondii]KFG28393.1 ATP-dependent Clp protease adaptor protein ClpS protein [Toxoplasma gondii p89]KFG35942.1 ATP-dependent Clp protease adaptor protein Clp|eukprot:XP_002371520.1 ATP-dependent Clp protease adaptor protein ClpS protein [Toxoplasma gondii ME49]